MSPPPPVSRPAEAAARPGEAAAGTWAPPAPPAPAYQQPAPPPAGPQWSAPAAQSSPLAPAFDAGRPSGRKGLVVGLVVAGVVIVGLVIAGLLAMRSDSDTKSAGSAGGGTDTSVPAPAPAPAQGSKSIFDPIPGFTLTDAPESFIDEVKQGFEIGVRGSLQNLPGLSVDADEIIVGVEGRTVERNGGEVGLAISGSFSPEWASRIPHDEFLDELGERGGAGSRVTVAGHDAVYLPADPAELLVAYEGSRFVMVFAEGGDRVTTEAVMAGLLANLD